MTETETKTIEELKKKIHELELEIAKLKGANEALMALYHSRPTTTIIERNPPKPRTYPPPFPLWPKKYPSYESKFCR
ncbi:MAG TPA: hypothetical protein HA319_06100 [Nitrosopumilaceae archaeon]|nr:hypothetical protein [Nitrosopumilaceae archaeon]